MHTCLSVHVGGMISREEGTKDGICHVLGAP